MSELQRRTEMVSDRVLQLFARFFDGVAEIDYLTIFTATQEEQQYLDREAKSMGALIGDKNGRVYRLGHDVAADLPTSVVRICNPRKTDQIGCADIIVTDYPDVKRQASNLPRYREMHKTNHGISYDIIEIPDPDLQVSIYLPSIRMLGNVIEINTQ